jgi:hypothetical protein
LTGLSAIFQFLSPVFVLEPGVRGKDDLPVCINHTNNTASNGLQTVMKEPSDSGALPEHGH